MIKQSTRSFQQGVIQGFVIIFLSMCIILLAGDYLHAKIYDMRYVVGAHTHTHQWGHILRKNYPLLVIKHTHTKWAIPSARDNAHLKTMITPFLGPYSVQEFTPIRNTTNIWSKKKLRIFFFEISTPHSTASSAPKMPHHSPPLT